MLSQTSEVEESLPSPRKPGGACGELVPVAHRRMGKVAGLQRKPGEYPVFYRYGVCLLFSLSFTCSLTKSVFSPSKELLYYSVL